MPGRAGDGHSAVARARECATLSAVPEPLHILVFGQSNSAGAVLPGGALPWPQLLAAALPDALGRPAAVTFRTFYAHAAGSAAYLDRELAKYSPDLVILTMTPFAFLQPMVGPGVRKRYGERAYRLYQRLESRFDRVTRDRGEAAGSANRLARRITRAVLGAAPVADYETVRDATVAALRRVAREEDLRVLAFQGFVRVPEGSARSRRAAASLLERFFVDMRAACGQAHCDYINLNEAHREDLDRWYYPDRLHVTAEAHALTANAVLQWVIQAAPPPV